MRKSVLGISKEKLDAIKFNQSPNKQILGLPITAELQVLLINFFSNDYTKYKLSINGIANSFGVKKNTNRVKKALEELAALKLITITDDSYIINLDEIQRQYLLQIKTTTESSTTLRSSFTKSILPSVVGGITESSRDELLPCVVGGTTESSSLPLPCVVPITLTVNKKKLDQDKLNQKEIDKEKISQSSFSKFKLSESTLQLFSIKKNKHNEDYSTKVNFGDYIVILIGSLIKKLNEDNTSIDNEQELVELINANIITPVEMNKQIVLCSENEIHYNQLENYYLTIIQ